MQYQSRTLVESNQLFFAELYDLVSKNEWGVVPPPHTRELYKTIHGQSFLSSNCEKFIGFCLLMLCWTIKKDLPVRGTFWLAAALYYMAFCLPPPLGIGK